MRTDIQKKAKTCSACLNAGRNLNKQSLSTEQSKIEPPKIPRDEIQIDITGNLNRKHLNSSSFILVAVDKNSRWPAAKICNNTDHDTVESFLRDNINIYGVLRTIKFDRGSTFISTEYKRFFNEYNPQIRWPNLHNGTGLGERTMQSMKNLIKVNLAETQN